MFLHFSMVNFDAMAGYITKKLIIIKFFAETTIWIYQTRVASTVQNPSFCIFFCIFCVDSQYELHCKILNLNIVVGGREVGFLVQKCQFWWPDKSIIFTILRIANPKCNFNHNCRQYKKYLRPTYLVEAYTRNVMFWW